MSAEDQYKTIERPIIPDVDTLFVLRRTGTVRFPMNTLQDIVTEAGVHQGVSPNDDLYTWANFRAMVEGVYGNQLQTAIDANPIQQGEDALVWWKRVTDVWLVDYMAAHTTPKTMTNTLDGWDGSGYISPENEPVGSLIPPA
jgi:hypothetical protein